MRKKIKKGRYPGQPEGTPDCEMYKMGCEERYITPPVWGDKRLFFDERGCCVNIDAEDNISGSTYNPIYEPEKRVKSINDIWEWMFENKWTAENSGFSKPHYWESGISYWSYEMFNCCGKPVSECAGWEFRDEWLEDVE